jgi:hypothetical protein
MAEHLEQLIYTSTASREVDAGGVFKIVETSAQNNRTRNITGVLAYVNGHFFQAIEGDREQLDLLMRALQADNRHHSIRVLLRKSIDTRQFADWRMKRLPVTDNRAASAMFRRLLVQHRDAREILRQFETYLESRAA